MDCATNAVCIEVKHIFNKYNQTQKCFVVGSVSKTLYENDCIANLFGSAKYSSEHMRENPRFHSVQPRILVVKDLLGFLVRCATHEVVQTFHDFVRIRRVTFA